MARLRKLDVPEVVLPPPEPPARHLVGYARVSMADQNCQRQIDELTRFGVSPLDIFTDAASGKDMDRPGWQALWKDIREGDLVVTLSVDRLGRDVIQILQTVEALQHREVGLKVLSGDIDTGTVSGRLVLNILAALAQWERELIVERTQHGLAKARERGVVGGRPEKINQAMILDTIARLAKREPMKQIAAGYKVHTNSLTRRVEAHRKAQRIKGSEK